MGGSFFDGHLGEPTVAKTLAVVTLGGTIMVMDLTHLQAKVDLVSMLSQEISEDGETLMTTNLSRLLMNTISNVSFS